MQCPQLNSLTTNILQVNKQPLLACLLARRTTSSSKGQRVDLLSSAPALDCCVVALTKGPNESRHQRRQLGVKNPGPRVPVPIHQIMTTPHYPERQIAGDKALFQAAAADRANLPGALVSSGHLLSVRDLTEHTPRRKIQKSMLMSSYMIKSYIYNRLEGNGALGMAASLKTNRIGF
jgi:hypothetical protein